MGPCNAEPAWIGAPNSLPSLALPKGCPKLLFFIQGSKKGSGTRTTSIAETRVRSVPFFFNLLSSVPPNLANKTGRTPRVCVRPPHSLNSVGYAFNWRGGRVLPFYKSGLCISGPPEHQMVYNGNPQRVAPVPIWPSCCWWENGKILAPNGSTPPYFLCPPRWVFCV